MKKASILAKILTVPTVLAMVLSLSACGGGDTASPSGSTGNTAAGSDKDVITIGRVVPLTGFLASFGVGTPDVEQKAIDAINEEGGIYIKEYDKKLQLKLVTVDSESDSTKASEAATKLITQDKVDILTASHTPVTVNAVSAAAERNKMPCITVEAPSDPWFNEGDHYWSFHTGFTIEAFCNTYINMWDQMDTNKVVGLLMDNQDGASFSPQMVEIAKERGYEIIDPGLITVGTKDYTSIINQFKSAGVEIVTGNMNLPDFTTCWNQFQQSGYTPKIVSVGRAALFPDNAEAIGNAEGITTEIWWSPIAPYTSQLFNLSASDLGAWYEETTGETCSAVIGYKYANMEIAIDALQRAESLDPQALRDAIAATDLDTIIGHIKYNDQQYSEPMLLGGQWTQDADGKWVQNIIDNTNNTDVPLSETPFAYLPGSEG